MVFDNRPLDSIDESDLEALITSGVSEGKAVEYKRQQPGAGHDEVREFLYRKWDENTVGAAVEVRQAAVIARTQFKIKSQRKKALKIFDRLVRDADLTYEEAFKEFAQEFPTLVEPKLPKPRSLINSVRNLADILSQYEPEFLEAYRKRKKPPLDEVVNAVRSLIAAAQGFLKRLKH